MPNEPAVKVKLGHPYTLYKELNYYKFTQISKKHIIYSYTTYTHKKIKRRLTILGIFILLIHTKLHPAVQKII